MTSFSKNNPEFTSLNFAEVLVENDALSSCAQGPGVVLSSALKSKSAEIVYLIDAVYRTPVWLRQNPGLIVLRAGFIRSGQIRLLRNQEMSYYYPVKKERKKKKKETALTPFVRHLYSVTFTPSSKSFLQKI